MLLGELAADLCQAGIESPSRELRLLVAHVLEKRYEDVFFATDLRLSEGQTEHLARLVQRRCAGEPLAKIIGHKEFWGLDFIVTSDTLDPRPDSETLIQAVLGCVCDKNSPLTIIDFGTGTGCLMISLLSEFPNAHGFGVDKSENAITVARKNADRLGFLNRAAFLVGDWATAVRGTFDIVISNPPYIGLNEPLDRSVSDYDPHQALYGGKDGLACYESLLPQIHTLCHQGSKIFLEIGQGQGAAVRTLAKHNGLAFARSHPDLAGIERILEFRMYARFK